MTLVVSTPASTAAGNDQSAAVFDFDCIYSHDIQRKRQKRWHDGFLRFHAFNRRVMVYDVPRNFIGDTHLRDADTLQDGDELQLDRGILVEVGESRGASRQDVTPLFEKKRAQPQRTQAEPPPPPRASHSSPPTSSVLLKPKPLNVVLGPRRGLQGRAVLAKHSPYEHTKSPEHNLQRHDFQRPAKRARVEEPHRALPAPRRNTEQHMNIRKASSLLPSDRPDRPTTNNPLERSPKHNVTRQIPSPTPVRAQEKTDIANFPAQVKDAMPDRILNGHREHIPAQSKERLTSKLKVSATKRPKLMCLSGAATAQKSDTRPVRSEEPSVPKRRAPLRVSAMDLSSSPTSANFTVMDYPTSQDFFAEQTPVPQARTLAELDQELLSPPDLPGPRPVPKIASASVKPPNSPAAALAVDLPSPPKAAAPPSPSPPSSPPPPNGLQAPPPPTALIAFQAPQPDATTTLSKPIAAPPTEIPAETTPSAPPATPTHRAAAISTAVAAAAAAGPIRSLRRRTSPLKKSLSDPALLARRQTAETGPVSIAARKATPPSLHAKPAATSTSTSTATTTVTTTPTTSTKSTTEQPPPPSVAAEAETGPWSRTAFDLFGFVVPPGAKEAEIRALKTRVSAIRGSVRGMMREYCD